MVIRYGTAKKRYPYVAAFNFFNYKTRRARRFAAELNRRDEERMAALGAA